MSSIYGAFGTPFRQPIRSQYFDFKRSDWLKSGSSGRSLVYEQVCANQSERSEQVFKRSDWLIAMTRGFVYILGVRN